MRFEIGNQWNLPHAKKCPPDTFCTSVCTGAALSIPLRNQKEKTTHMGGLLLVELRGIEPLSEGNLERTSPGAVCYLHSLTAAGTNTLRGLVAS